MSAKAPPIRVLLVEDDSYLLSLYANKLVAENFKVYSARDGLEALRAFKKYSPQVIIIDLNLPEMSGSDALAVMAKDFGETKPLCVVLSNYDRDIAEVKSPLPDIVAAYFLKINTTPQEVIDAVRDLYQNKIETQ